jgi:hypothetical protein
MTSAERIGLLVCGLCFATAAGAAGKPTGQQDPDAEFLEYLGMWEETDEEWLLHDGMLAFENEDESESPEEEDSSPETEDES